MATCTDLHIILELEDTLRGSEAPRQHYLATYMFGGRSQEYMKSLLNTSYHTPFTPNPTTNDAHARPCLAPCIGGHNNIQQR